MQELHIHYKFLIDEPLGVNKAVLMQVIQDERAVNCLLRAQCKTLTDITTKSAEDLLAQPIFGTISLEKVRRGLASVGLYLRDERPARLPERV